MPRLHYVHTQVGWLIIGGMAPVALIATPALMGAGLTLGSILSLAMVVVVLLLFGALRVRVTDAHVEVRFGVGLIRRRIALDSVRSCSAVRNPWYYGWGIRFIPGGWLYNVSGLLAVELMLHDGGRVRIGTDEPETLMGVLMHRLGTSRPLSPDEMEIARRQSRRSVAAVVAVSALVFSAVAAMMYFEMRPPSVRVSGGVFEVRSAIYSAALPLGDIVEVALLEAPPRILVRTNGFSRRGTRRGNFRVEGLGRGKLFIEIGAPPYVLIRTPESFVMVNFADPERTRSLHAEITAALE